MKLPACDVAVVLGSGLSQVAPRLLIADPIPYSDIDEMPTSSVPGHEGHLYAGVLSGKRVCIFAGRVHLYEGHDARTVTRWVHLAKSAGCHTFLLTNAAGGISDRTRAGDPYLISDHLNLTGASPLTGPNDESLGPRFPDMTEIYDAELRALAQRIDDSLEEGVYAGLPGPAYETPAEVRMLAAMGADLVGMSTVLEAMYARYLGARVFGLSIVTNKAAGLGGEPLDHDEVAAAGLAARDRVATLLEQLIVQM